MTDFCSVGDQTPILFLEHLAIYTLCMIPADLSISSIWSWQIHKIVNHFNTRINKHVRLFCIVQLDISKCHRISKMSETINFIAM